jgi:hypothetical protein
LAGRTRDGVPEADSWRDDSGTRGLGTIEDEEDFTAKSAKEDFGFKSETQRTGRTRRETRRV